jgi:cytoskeletal protein RodZ
MPPEDINFQTFFAAKIKDRSLSIKKISEATGIAPAHLESMAHGRFDDLPSSPYVRGYLIRLGKVLDFDGEEWWEKIKKERIVSSGPTDSLPGNRFIRQSHTKLVWIAVVIAVVIIYLAFQIPIIFSSPRISVILPDQNPYTTSSSTFTLEGSVRGADSLTLNGDTVTISATGSWQKTVLLQNGPNTFEISAQKLLGGKTTITEQIFYQGGATATTTATTTTGAETPTSTQNSTTTSL